MADNQPQEDFHYSHFKSPGGVIYSLLRDVNKDDLYGAYDAILTKPKSSPTSIYHVHIDAQATQSNLTIHSVEKTISKHFQQPETAISFVDTFVKDHKLINFAKPESDREYLTIGS